MTKRLMMGNEAFAYAALEAGVDVVAGYPGTPSSELIETVAKAVASGVAEGVHVEWSTNEAAALGMLAGASYSGARTLFTCKQMGLNVAGDVAMSLNYVGVEGGCVLYVADDPGPISSQTEQDTRRYGSFSKIPVLDPENIEQGMDMMKAAFDLSERYRTPVIVRPTTRVCHSSTFVDVPEHTQGRAISGFVKDDSRFVIFPARSTRGHHEVLDRLQAIEQEYGCDAGAAEVFVPAGKDDPRPALGLGRFNPVETHGRLPRLGVVCGGVSTAYTREALGLLESEFGDVLPAYRLMQVGTAFPFPRRNVQAFVEGLERIIVFEELDGVLEDGLINLMGERAMRGRPVAQVLGRRSGDARSVGENTVDDIAQRLAVFFGVDVDAADDGSRTEAGTSTGASASHEEIELPVRPPVLCPGCPHRGAFYAAKRALKGRPAVLSGDIGCYTLGNAQPLDAVDTCLCMGAGITMAQGLAVANPEVKQLAFIGDSTYFASGMTGVANAVYNQHDITICVLDNSTTAMTGGQPHPGTGRTLMGPTSEPIDIAATLQALGVSYVEHVNPHNLAASEQAIRRAVDVEGPSAVIFEAPCVNLIARGKPAVVDAEACTGCKKCITTIGCPAIGFDGVHASVDPSLCNGCGQCLQVCPFGCIGGAEMPDAGADGGAKRVREGAGAQATPGDAGVQAASAGAGAQAASAEGAVAKGSHAAEGTDMKGGRR